MSHTTTLKGVQIKDAQVIRQTVQDLMREGINIELRENAKPRMYFARQAEEIGDCEFVLHLPESNYDVGLKWNGETAQYDVFLDTWAGQVAGAIGATCPMPTNAGKQGEHAIGRFSQRYGINAARKTALEQFPMASIIEQPGENGEIQLVIEGV